MLTVRDLLRIKGEAIWAVSPETSTMDAIRLMATQHIGALLVLEDGLLAGIISERDFVYRIAGEGAFQLDTPIRDYMTTKVITITPEQTIEDCMQLMTDKRIRHLPVVEHDKLIGLISIGDVVKGIINEQSSTIHNLEDYILGVGYGH